MDCLQAGFNPAQLDVVPVCAHFHVNCIVDAFHFFPSFLFPPSFSPYLTYPFPLGVCARQQSCVVSWNGQAASRVVIDTEYVEVGAPLDELSSFFSYAENDELAEGRALFEADLADGTSLNAPTIIRAAPARTSKEGRRKKKRKN